MHEQKDGARILPLPDASTPNLFTLEGREMLCRNAIRDRVEALLIPLYLEEVCESFERHPTFRSWVEAHAPATLGVEDLHELADLWNLTPRADLEGYRPLELYLREAVLEGTHDSGAGSAAELPSQGDATVERQSIEQRTRHIPSPVTHELLNDDRLLSPAFILFVEDALLSSRASGRRQTPVK